MQRAGKAASIDVFCVDGTSFDPKMVFDPNNPAKNTVTPYDYVGLSQSGVVDMIHIQGYGFHDGVEHPGPTAPWAYLARTAIWADTAAADPSIFSMILPNYALGWTNFVSAPSLRNPNVVAPESLILPHKAGPLGLDGLALLPPGQDFKADSHMLKCPTVGDFFGDHTKDSFYWYVPSFGPMLPDQYEPHAFAAAPGIPGTTLWYYDDVTSLTNKATWPSALGMGISYYRLGNEPLNFPAALAN